MISKTFQLEDIFFYKNHFKSGFDEHFSNNSDSAHFHYISIGRLTRYPLKPIDEAVLAARLIGERLKSPVLCLSGGLDSEAMALSFLKAGVPFTAAIMNLSNGLNEYDTAPAHYFCNQHKIPVQEIHISAVDLLMSGDHLNLASQYETQSPERALFIMFLKQIKGNPVLAGEIFRREKSHGQVALCCPKHRDLAYWRYFAAEKIPAVPYFHYYTPELTYSFIAHTDIGSLDYEMTDWSGQHAAFYAQKLKIYRQSGFEILDTSLRKQKWHGYEGLKIKFDSLYNSDQAYNRTFRVPLEQYPIYDINQILLVPDNDPIARELMGFD